jgi:glyoxylase I family protein
MLGVSGYAHFSITVSDLARSADWYEEVLGLERIREIDKPTFKKVIFQDHASNIALSLTHHLDKASNDLFTETRTGLDHLALVVPSYKELEAWQERLDEFEVPHTEILQTATGAVLIFRDPDNVQLEFYAATDSVDENNEATDNWRHNFPPVHPGL